MIDKTFIDSHLDGLKECVVDASKAILDVYESSDFGEINKKDGSPLTIADKNANEIILNRLNQLTPDIPIISEETFELSSLNNLNETYWLVDPLDGTKEFINKTDEFTVNIALIKIKVLYLALLLLQLLEKFGTAQSLIEKPKPMQVQIILESS